MEKPNYDIKILEDYDNSLKTEEGGTPPKKDGSKYGIKEPSSGHPYLKWVLGGIIFFLLLSIFFLVFMNLDGQECLSNPFIYGAREAQNQESGGLMCRCNFENPNYAPFYFNESSLEIGFPLEIKG